MKILIVSQYYWPEPFRITDIAESLVKLGHDVTVLTGLPNYPNGKIYDGYNNRCNRIETHNGVKIIRCRLHPREANLVSRYLNYKSFPKHAKRMVKRLDSDFDVVLANMLSPIMSITPAIEYKKLHKAKIVMYEMDLWPESLLAGGIKKGSPFYNHYKKISSKIYAEFDRILASTKEHIDYISSLDGCNNIEIHYLPQYAEDIFKESKASENKNNNHLDIMFAGNIGKAQSLHTMIYALDKLRDQDITFHVVGDGSEKQSCESLSKKLRLDNIIFYGRKPLEDMPSLYEKADMMYLSLENKTYSNMTMPGKLQTYLAVGKPILGCISGASANLINETGCGVATPAEDVDALVKTIKELDKSKFPQYSKNALNACHSLFDKDIFMDKLIKYLKFD